MDAQLKKGVLELCLLSSVRKEPRYGYDVIRSLREFFPDVEDSAFYVILRRLHREGVLEQIPGRESGGPPRKYYQLTQRGQEELARLYTDWKCLTQIVDRLTEGFCPPVE